MPSFTVKIALRDDQAAQVQNLGAMLKVSAEDVLAAAVKVGLTDWEAVEADLVVNPSGRLEDSQRQAPAGLHRFHAVLDLGPAEADLVSELAEWDNVDVSVFLSRCLASGIHHARAVMQAEDAKAIAEAKRTPGNDDDLPF